MSLVVAPLFIHQRAIHREKELLKNYQAVYEQAYEGNREFSFDDTGWVLKTESGRQEVSWASRFWSGEFSKTIAVVSRDQLVLIIPKRIFSEEEFNTLRKHAIGENNGFVSRIGLTDYVVSQAPILWRQRPLAITLWYTSGFTLSLFLALAMRRDSEVADPFGWVFVGGILVLVAGSPFLYLALKYEDSARYFYDRWRVQCSGTGVHVRTVDCQFFISWVAFKKVTEGLRCFVLESAGREPYLVSIRCTPADQAEQLRRNFSAALSVNEKAKEIA